MKTPFPSVFVLLIALSLSGCFNQKKDISEYLTRARQYIAEDNTEKAKIELRNALQQSPNDVQANLALAKIEDKEGDLQGAVPHYLRAATPDAHLIEPQLRLVEILLDSERFQDATGRINATLGSFPGNADALALRADLAERQGTLPAAKTDADNALLKDPTNARALAVRAMLELRAQDGQGALELVDRGLARNPDDLRLLQVQAAALLTLNQPGKAVDALKSIVRSAPRNVSAQSALAGLEASNGRFEEALATFRAAVSADPANQEMQFAFIKFLATQKAGDEVVSYLNQLIEKYPSAATYDLALAGIYQQKGQIDQCRAVLERAIARLGTSKEVRPVRVALAKVESTSGRATRANDQLASVLADDAQNEDALLLRAFLGLQNGRVSAAVADLVEVVRNNPVSARAFQDLATAYLAQGQPKLAVDAMKRAVAVVPGDDNAQLRLAAFLENAGDAIGARDLMARLTLRHPDNAFVWTANAQIAIDRKDWAAVSLSLAKLRGIPGSEKSITVLEGQMQAARGDNTGAAENYRAVLAAQTDVDSSLVGAFARASVAAGQTADAARFLEQRAPSLKGEAQLQAWIAAMNLDAADAHSDKAGEAFKKATSLSPQRPEAYLAYAGILVAKKDFDKALKVVEAGLAAGAPRSTLLDLRGWVEQGAGDLAAAEASYREASTLNPLALSPANNYGSLVADRHPKNVEVLTDARNRLIGSESTNNPLVVDTIAWLDYRLGRLDEAKELLTRIKAGQSDNPQIRFHMAAVLLGAGEKSNGLALLDTVKGLTFPGSEEVQSLSAT